MNMFEYVMVLASIIIGLGIANLLQGFATIVQHPTRKRAYWVHLVWGAYLFVLAVFWWWWEFTLRTIHDWSFELYLFVLGYAFLIYLVCALLFPNDLDEYADYKEYFYSRRFWFFGLQVVYLGVDFVDSWLKGPAHFASLGLEYVVASVLQMVLCAAAPFIRNERFHAVFAVAMLAYQTSWAMRYIYAVN